MLFTYLENMFVTNRDMEFHFSYEPGMVWAEANLIKSVLVNLLDNACKASEPGSPIEGYRRPAGKRLPFSVKDREWAFRRKSRKILSRPFIWWTSPVPEQKQGRVRAGSVHADTASARKQAGN